MGPFSILDHIPIITIPLRQPRISIRHSPSLSHTSLRTAMLTMFLCSTLVPVRRPASFTLLHASQTSSYAPSSLKRSECCSLFPRRTPLL